MSNDMTKINHLVIQTAEYLGSVPSDDDSFDAKIKVTGTFNGIKFEVFDTIAVALKQDLYGRFYMKDYESHFIEGNGDNYQIFLDGKEDTADNYTLDLSFKDKLDSFLDYIGWDNGSDKLQKALIPLKSQILEVEENYFSESIGDYLDSEKESRDPLGYRGLSQSDFI
jgi:hypothetical protein